MLRIILVLIGFIGTSNLTFAQDIQQEKVKVLNVLKRYAEVTSCETDFEDEDHKFPLSNIFLVDDEEDDTAYYVYWRADFGCRGGSGTTHLYISEIGHYRDPLF